MPPFSSSDALDRARTKDPLENVYDDLHYHALDRTVATKPKRQYIPTTASRKSTSDVRFASVLPSHHHKATLEIALQSKDETLVLQQKSRLNLHTSFPVYNNHFNQHVVCDLTGMSSLRGRTGYCTGLAGLRWSHTGTVTGRRTTLSAAVGSAGGTKKSITNHYLSTVPMQLGISTISPKSGGALSANLTIAKPRPSGCSLSIAANRQLQLPRRLLHNPIQLRAQLSSLSVKKPVALTVAVSNGSILNSSPSRIGRQPQWNLRLGCDHQVNGKRPVHPHIGLSFFIPHILQRPRLFDLSLFWKRGFGWRIGGTWTHSKKVSRRLFSVGALWNVSANMNPSTISWILTWTEGDFTLRVPILLSSSAATASALYSQQAFHFFYLGFLSGIIRDVIGAMVDSPMDEEGDKVREKEKDLSVRRLKARDEALLQQSFMERQAKIRMQAEQERNGLVIQRAVYYLRNDSKSLNDDNSLDVTIPMQFWVTESKLHLFEISKRGSMLGFYDLTAFASCHQVVSTRLPVPEEEPDASPQIDLKWTDRLLSSWFNYGDRSSLHTGSHHADESSPIAELAVWYTYDGRSYEIIVDDKEEITLPSVRAKHVP